MRLMFANTSLAKDMKIKFMKCMQKMDEASIKELDNILDSQGGFTKEAAERYIKTFGPFSDQDVLLEQGCYMMLPDFDHKKAML